MPSSKNFFLGGGGGGARLALALPVMYSIVFSLMLVNPRAIDFMEGTIL